VAKKISRLPRFRKAPLLRSPEQRFNVTRAEYNRVIEILNDRTSSLNEFRDALDLLRRESAIQLRRTAEIQADLDDIKRTWQRIKKSV
jgi:hypothetical protein